MPNWSDEAELAPAMICNVFVCNVWKRGGVFGDLGSQFQCGETSVNDNYRLAVYSSAAPPAICAATDPANPLCQLGSGAPVPVTSVGCVVEWGVLEPGLQSGVTSCGWTASRVSCRATTTSSPGPPCWSAVLAWRRTTPRPRTASQQSQSNSIPAE